MELLWVALPLPSAGWSQGEFTTPQFQRKKPQNPVIFQTGWYKVTLQSGHRLQLGVDTVLVLPLCMVVVVGGGAWGGGEDFIPAVSQLQPV